MSVANSPRHCFKCSLIVRIVIANIAPLRWKQAAQEASVNETPLKEDAVFLMQRVAALERDLVKVQDMWNLNKGQRVIEVWMSILNRKSYKPSDM